jgi:two-component system nitrogen regulation sensor histidine kinase NtrY
LIIGKQIKQIENLVNEFSDFARMPKPILKNNNLVSLIKDNIKLINELDNKIIIDFKSSKPNILLNSDSEQLSRVFFNLIKNSIESIQDKKIDNINLIGKIDISINENEELINFIIIDNGLGFGIFENNIKDILNPYFTTKKKGTGLGLSIVNKIINDHNGKINFLSLGSRAKIEIVFIK